MDLSYQAEGRLDMLKQRAQRCVCKHCGGALNLRRLVVSEIDDARVEIFCEHCDRIEFGVEPEICQSAKYFVDEMGFNHYSDLEEGDRTRAMNIAKVCDIMAWENKQLGFLTKKGFTVPVNVNTNIMSETVVLNNRDIDELENTVGIIEDEQE